MKYTTSLRYTGRESKANYVFEKYKSLYSKNTLDVGADAQYLKNPIKAIGGNYVGIGFGSEIDIEFDLDGNSFPFDDNSFETVQCLDVLEHLNDFHFAFSELVRISNDKIIISLPNCWSLFFKMLIDEKSHPTARLKWWGLPVEKPLDRHRWFFSKQEVHSFFKNLEDILGYKLAQFDVEDPNDSLFGKGLINNLKSIVFNNLFRSNINDLGLNNGTIWVVLTKNKPN